MRFSKQLAFILIAKTYQNPVVEASWGVRGASWRPLGASWERLGVSWAHVGASCGRLGASWSVFERLERVFRRPGRVQTEIMLRTAGARDAAPAGPGEAQLSRRRKPYERNLSTEKLLTESECMRVSV